jgi:putative NADPH-quinone reductase
MNILLVLAHPSPGSFNHAIAETVAAELLRCGHQVRFHDLYREGFDPVLPSREIPREAEPDPAIALHCRDLIAADGIVIVHPDWWGMPPAILKGWIDRVLRPGTAYRFAEGDSGEGVPDGLLAARSALVLNTSNTPALREQEEFGDPLERLWRDCIFRFCGVPVFRRRMFGVVVTSSEVERHGWLREVRELAAEMFPADQE